MRIREFEKSDLENLFGTLSDPDVMTYIEDPYTFEDTQALLDDVLSSEERSIHAVEDDNGNYIGYVIFHPYEADSYELGWLLNKSEWGKGYASGLTEMMIEEARKKGMNAVIECDPWQEVTKHIAEKFGFRFDEVYDGCNVYRLQLVEPVQTKGVLLETERLIITELTPDMAEDVHKNSLDEDTRRFVPDEVFETLEDAEEVIDFLITHYWHADGPLVYALITKEDNKNIGYVQLVPIDNGDWEIGYHVAKPYTCKGYATEAVSAFLPFMAGRLGITKVFGIRLLENTASGRVLEKCGFKSFFTGEGSYHDGVYEIDKSVWRMESCE